MIEVLRSGVNTWECDRMGHMNVRYYFARANQGAAVLALGLGLSPSMLRQQGLALRARDQHVRFLRELRPGTSYTLTAGVVAASEERLHVYEELRFADKPEVAASMLSDFTLRVLATGGARPFSAAVLERARELSTEVSPQAAPRGIERTPPRVPPQRDEALARGMIGAYLAPVQAEDCDAHGVMLEAAFMARISDGIGHYFLGVRGPREERMGGAALEYRYVFHEFPRLGDIIEVRSALKGLGGKTTQICHWIFNLETGRCVATAEAVTVSFDLATRKAVDIPTDVRAELEKRVVPDLSV